jgi:hypothetical protein
LKFIPSIRKHYNNIITFLSAGETCSMLNWTPQWLHSPIHWHSALSPVLILVHSLVHSLVYPEMLLSSQLTTVLVPPVELLVRQDCVLLSKWDQNTSWSWVIQCTTKLDNSHCTKYSGIWYSATHGALWVTSCWKEFLNCCDVATKLRIY